MPLRILVVDDSLITRALLREFAEGCGHEVVEAETMQEALDAYRAQKPDLVTLDLSLADTDGLSVLKAIRALDETARVLLLAADVIVLPYLKTQTADCTLRIPEGFKWMPTPPFEHANVFGKVSFKAEQVGQELQVGLRVEVATAMAAPAAWVDFKQFLAWIEEAHRLRIQLEKS